VKLIVGLGNPGARYESTRHNLGFRVVDELGSRWSIPTSQEKFHAWFGPGVIRDQPVVLLKPTTFMNRSGQAVQPAGRFYRLELEDLLVISDDLSLPVGRLRMRRDGSAGGHLGLSDIIQRLGSESFARLRIGIGEAIGDPAVYVLEPFSPEEGGVISSVIRRAADAVEGWITEGPEATMNRFNGLADLGPPPDAV
jgi:PTH1 family peptidyl-tRNA hydrolase